MIKKSIALILMLFIVSDALCATQLKKTVKPSGGDYTSLEACMNANEQDLVAADKYFDVEIDGTWSSADTTACTIHNYNTDATRYINIYTTSAARHQGVWSTSYYRLALTGYAIGLTITANNVTIAGFQTSVLDGQWCIWVNATGVQDVRLSKIIATVSSANPGNGFGLITSSGASGSKVYLMNSIIYHCAAQGSYRAGIRSADANGTLYCYSVTAVNNSRNFERNAGTLICKNCIGQTADEGDYVGVSAGSDYNLSMDATAVGATHYDSKTVTFVSASNFHLGSTDTEAIDKGVDTSGESAPLNFSDDIDGVARSGTWDLGADEYVSAGTSSGWVWVTYD
jgi:hypothetical protein